MAISNAVGIIEVLGLAAGISVADAALKAANVRLLGYEVLPGFGWVNIKITGDVGAVNAAVAAATAAASGFSTEYCKLVIPRPHEDTKKLIETILHPVKPDPEVSSGFIVKKQTEEVIDGAEEAADAVSEEESGMEENIQAEPEVSGLSEPEADGESEPESAEDSAADINTDENAAQTVIKTETDEAALIPVEDEDSEFANAVVSEDVRKEATCNICNDVNCPRKRGQSHKLCIHYLDQN